MIQGVLFYKISFKTLIDKVDQFITVYDETRYLILFGSENTVTFAIEADIL